MWKGAARVLGRDRAVRGRSAEDAVGTAIEEAMRPGTRLPTTSLCGWLATIAIRRARDILRASRLETPTDDDLEPEAEIANVEETAVAAVLVQRAKELLPSLPAPEQHAIRERLMAGRPAKDVADELGCTPQNVSNIVTRALTTLREDAAFTTTSSFDLQTEASAGGVSGEPDQ